jgi:cbb3-type cytochrome oxidase maturation protein
MYYLGWIILTATGISVSIAAFIWALRTGQFSDQSRARYLPLRGEMLKPSATRASRLSIEVYVLLFVLGAGVVSMIFTVALTLSR